MSLKIERLLNQAQKKIKKEQFDDARKDFLSILEISPMNQKAKQGLAKLDQNIQIKPTQSQLQLVIDMFTRGDSQNALKKIEEMIVQFPNEASIFNIKGVIFKSLNNNNLAAECFNKAISLAPDFVQSHFNLGVICQENNNLDEALNFYKKALAIDPTYSNANNNLGLIHLDRNNLRLAISHFELAIKAQPSYSEAHNNLGAAFQVLNEFNEAIKCFETAVLINPSYAQAQNNLGISFQAIGQKNLAIRHYENAINISPGFASAHHNLSRIKTYKENDFQITEMISQLDKNLNYRDRGYLCFALANAYDYLGNFKKQFKFLNEGNKIFNKNSNYSIQNDKDKISLIKRIFTSNDVNSIVTKNKKNTDFQPIFILGMPRSGTTLVEQIISSHSEVYGADEINIMSKLSISVLKDCITNNISSLNEGSFDYIHQEYLNELNQFEFKCTTVTDKWPLNFQYIGFILGAFPNAKIIHLKRDAMATCWSIYKHLFSDESNGWAYNQVELAEYFNSYNELMNFWHELYPNKIYDLCYEDLTKYQEIETKKLLDYCELSWEDKCLNFHENKRAVKTASTLQVRKKIYQGSSDSWKKYDTYLKPLLNQLKYLQ
jgi:tetratricopeptide (TPR) repeat protein